MLFASLLTGRTGIQKNKYIWLERSQKKNTTMTRQEPVEKIKEKLKFKMVFYITLRNLLLFSLIVCNLTKTCAGDNVKKSVDENRDDNGDTNDEAKDESLDIPIEPNEQQPGVVSTPNVTCSRRSNSRMHEIKSAAHKQFPFMASVMSNQNEHLCSGSVVSNGLILTSAQCTQLPVSYVLLNATRAKKDETTVPLHVIKTERFPTFVKSDDDRGKDVGLIYTEKHNSSIAAKIRLSNFTSSRNVVDMEVLGFGLNADVGQAKELQYIGAENRLSPIHPTDIKDELTAYIDCIDTKVNTCFKDFGGPSIFDDELVGVVMQGDDICFKEMTASYSVNKKLADILPTYTFKAWLDEKIKKNEEHDLVDLATFPNKLVASRRQLSKPFDVIEPKSYAFSHKLEAISLLGCSISILFVSF